MSGVRAADSDGLFDNLMIYLASRQSGTAEEVLHKGLNRRIHDASASVPMITVRPARPRRTDGLFPPLKIRGGEGEL
jgi:hypothetical protein